MFDYDAQQKEHIDMVFIKNVQMIEKWLSEYDRNSYLDKQEKCQL